MSTSVTADNGAEMSRVTPTSHQVVGVDVEPGVGEQPVPEDRQGSEEQAELQVHRDVHAPPLAVQAPGVQPDNEGEQPEPQDVAGDVVDAVA